MNYFESLVTDRTGADVRRAAYLNGLWNPVIRQWRGTAAELSEWRDGPVGMYNAKDLNRVQRGAAYLARRLREYGYGTPALPAAYLVDVDVRPPGAGRADGNIFYEGETAVLAALPEPGSTFLFWEEAGVTVSEGAEYRFQANRDRQLTAVFQRSGDYSGVVGYGRIGKAEIGKGLT